MHYFSIFFKKFNNPSIQILCVWTKNAILGNFEKILTNFDENSIEKLNFLFFWKNLRKIQDL